MMFLPALMVLVVALIAVDSYMLGGNHSVAFYNEFGESVVLESSYWQWLTAIYLLVLFAFLAFFVLAFSRRSNRRISLMVIGLLVGWFICLILPNSVGNIRGENFTSLIIILITALLGIKVSEKKFLLLEKHTWFVLLFFFGLFLLGATDCIWGGKLGYEQMSRWRGPFLNSNKYGFYCALGSLINFFLFIRYFTYFRKHESSRRALFLVPIVAAFSACVLGLMYSLSRTAIWSLLLVFLVVFILLSKKYIWIYLISYSSIGGIFIGYNYINGGDAKTSSPSRIIQFPKDSSWGNRLKCWNANIRIGWDHPGRGVGWSYMELVRGSYRPKGLLDVRAAGLNDFSKVFAAKGIPGLMGLFFISTIIVIGPFFCHMELLGKYFLIGAGLLLLAQMMVNEVITSLDTGTLLFTLLFFIIFRVGSSLKSDLDILP